MKVKQKHGVQHVVGIVLLQPNELFLHYRTHYLLMQEHHILRMKHYGDRMVLEVPETTNKPLIAAIIAIIVAVTVIAMVEVLILRNRILGFQKGIFFSSF